MNKSAIALAVAAALAASAAAQAETVLYGSARVGVQWQDLSPTPSNPVDAAAIAEQEDEWDVSNESSRLGVRGSEDLGNGLLGIYQYEFGVDLTNDSTGTLESNRPKFVGLKGGFGQISIGTQWRPYYNVIGVGDVFNGVGFGSDRPLSEFQGARIPGHYLGGLTAPAKASGFRAGNSIFYRSPDFAGLTFEGMLVVDDAAGGDDAVDLYDLALIYRNGPIFAGATYANLEVEGEEAAFDVPGLDLDEIRDEIDNFFADEFEGDQFGVAAGWTSDTIAATLSYELVNPDISKDDLETDNLLVERELGEFALSDDADSIYGTVSYSFGANIVRASYGLTSVDLEGGDDVKFDSLGLGFQHNLSARTRVWVEYFGEWFEDDDFEELETDVVSIGVRHDF